MLNYVTDTDNGIPLRNISKISSKTHTSHADRYVTKTK